MSIVDKVREMLGGHGDKAKDAVGKAGDMADKKTGGKYADKIDMGQEKASEYIDRSRPNDTGTPPSKGTGTPPTT
ncbi:antitoxin [Actinomadura rudentiformis]|uniref:Antitoxin n=1 Tax=Actinomadura rudentiformis TaxID=359158 RepID=A0A6H9YPV6_9ACTN|nr:antitoxin [Actinomadura rudentiformis]KAB2345630.1 antitoxin [Actinomadura rudentiformis]